MEFFIGRDLHVRVLLTGDLCNQSRSLSASVIQKETPSALLVGYLKYGLPQITLHQCTVVDPGKRFVFLLSSSGGSALPGRTLRLRVRHQTCVETSLPEVHPPCYPVSYLPGPEYAQRLCKNDVRKDEVSLRVPTPTNNTLPVRGQYFCEPMPYCTRGCGIPANQLHI